MFVVPLVLQRILEVTSVSKLQRVQHLGHTAGSPSVRGCTALHSRRTMGDEHEVTHVLGRLVEQLLHELLTAMPARPARHRMTARLRSSGYPDVLPAKLKSTGDAGRLRSTGHGARPRSTGDPRFPPAPHPPFVAVPVPELAQREFAAIESNAALHRNVRIVWGLAS